MAQGNYQLGGEEVREESSWRYPLIILVTTLLLCGVFVYYYFGPDVDEIRGNYPRPTINDDPIDAIVGDMRFSVPANYTVLPRDRQAGQRASLALYASWPRMDGYTPARRVDFIENAADARRIDILIHTRQIPFGATEKLEVLYLPQVEDEAGSPYDYDLTRYTFRQQAELGAVSGFSDREMYLAETDAEQEPVIIFCYPGSPDDPVAPECFRDLDLTDRVAVKYRFKRPYLSEWREIDRRVKVFLEDITVE